MGLPKSIVNLAEKFSYLPGIGPKLSNRIALYLAVSNKKLGDQLSSNLSDVVKNIRMCTLCFNVTDEGEYCEICRDEYRDRKTVLVVETAVDLYSIEQTSEYKGLYHVLNGVISPVNGIGPDDINILSLIKRVENDGIEEIIFGLNPNMEGDSTILYITNNIEETGKSVKLTRLAKGIPTGSSIEFMSNETLSDSLRRRDII